VAQAITTEPTANVPLPNPSVISARLGGQFHHGVPTPVDRNELGKRFAPTIQVERTTEFTRAPHLDLEPRGVRLDRKRLRTVAAVLTPTHLPFASVVTALHAMPSSIARSSAEEPR